MGTSVGAPTTNRMETTWCGPHPPEQHFIYYSQWRGWCSRRGKRYKEYNKNCQIIKPARFHRVGIWYLLNTLNEIQNECQIITLSVYDTIINKCKNLMSYIYMDTKHNRIIT